MLMGTFTGTALQWFSGIPDGHITSFPQFSRMLKEQFSANKVNPPQLYDLFNVKQREGEFLKEYLNRLCIVSIRLQTQDEEMVVAAFMQGMIASAFSVSVIRNPAETLVEVRERATTHIEAEEVVLRKNDNSCLKQPKYKENSRDRSIRSVEVSIEKRANQRYVLYVAKKDEPKAKAKEETTIRPKFRVSCNELVGMPKVSDKLKFRQMMETKPTRRYPRMLIYTMRNHLKVETSLEGELDKDQSI